MQSKKNSKPVILFLYTELAGYVLACLKELAKETEVHIVHWPVNKEAPFKLGDVPGCTFYDRSKFDENGLLLLAGCTSKGTFNPDVIICSGWVDKAYLKICRHYRGRIPTVLTMDNHWRNDFKQNILSLLSPFYLKRIFSQAWVPGNPQKEYALKLHFPEPNIQTGFYSADTGYFSGLFTKFKKEKEENFPKRFLYVGRYIQSKGIFTLWNAFIKAVEKTNSGWELWCLGTGELFGQRLEHPGIRHFGFVQPSEMETFIRQTGVFVLPSTFEPWGVVVHEMAAAGMPMICSDRVGAATQFLHSGQNGFSFPADNEKDLEALFIKFMQMTPGEFIRMSEASHSLGQQITPEIWANTVLGFLSPAKS